MSHINLSKRMIVNEELSKMWKKAVVVYLVTGLLTERQEMSVCHARAYFGSRILGVRILYVLNNTHGCSKYR